MRVVHVVPSIAEEASGPSYCVPALAAALAAEGCEVDLVTLEGGRLLESDRLRHHQFPVSYSLNRLGVSRAMQATLPKLVQQADIVHGHSFWMMPNVYPAWAAREAGKPLVMSPHGTLSPVALRRRSAVKKLFWRFLQGPAVRQVACLHAASPHECRDIHAAGVAAPVATIPFGIDIPAGPKARAPGTRTLLYLGRLHPIKGIDNLLHAWNSVQHEFPNWTLRLVGPDDNGYEASLKSLQHSLGLERVEFAGALYGDQKWAEYGAAEAYILPSLSENFAVTVTEAMACGLPVVVTNSTPWTDLDRRGVGWTVTPDAPSITSALRALMTLTPPQLAEVGARARAWMTEDFSWAKVARQTIEVYRWILDGGAPPPHVSYRA